MNCIANLGPIVAKKVLIWLEVSSGLIGLPESSFSWISVFLLDLLTSELTSCQNFLGLYFKLESLFFIKSARALRIILLASVLSSRALGSR